MTHYVQSWAITIEMYNPTHPMQTQYTDDLVDIIAEGMLPRSFVELYSVKQAYPHIAPEFQARIRPTLTVMPVWSVHYRSQLTSISIKICDFHLNLVSQ